MTTHIKRFSLPAQPEFLATFGPTVQHFDSRRTPTVTPEPALQEYIQECRRAINVGALVKDFQLQGACHGREEGSLIEPSSKDTIARIVANYNDQEIYGIITEGIQEYLQALRQGKKKPSLKPSMNTLLKPGEALYLPPPICNNAFLSVARNPHRKISGEGTREIVHIRRRDYNRVTLVIDFYLPTLEATAAPAAAPVATAETSAGYVLDAARGTLLVETQRNPWVL